MIQTQLSCAVNFSIEPVKESLEKTKTDWLIDLISILNFFSFKRTTVADSLSSFKIDFVSLPSCYFFNPNAER